MMRKHGIPGITATFLLLCLAGCAGQRAPAPDRNVTVPPGKFAELNLNMPPGGSAVATFEASSELAWNMHSHPAGTLVIHDEGVSASGRLELSAKGEGIHSFLWKNDGSTNIELDVKTVLSSGVTVHSWVP